MVSNTVEALPPFIICGVLQFLMLLPCQRHHSGRVSHVHAHTKAGPSSTFQNTAIVKIGDLRGFPSRHGQPFSGGRITAPMRAPEWLRYKPKEEKDLSIMGDA